MADLTLVTVNESFDDVSTADNKYIPIGPGLTGQLIQVRTVIGAAIATADNKLIIRKNGSAIGTITIAYTSSATGDQDYLDFTNDQIFLTEGDRLSLINGGESDNTVACGVSITIKR